MGKKKKSKGILGSCNPSKATEGTHVSSGLWVVSFARATTKRGLEKKVPAQPGLPWETCALCPRRGQDMVQPSTPEPHSSLVPAEGPCGKGNVSLLG